MVGSYRRRGAALVAIAALAVAAGGCGGGGKGKDSPKLHGTVTLGVLAPVEHAGPLGARGRDTMNGARMAVNEINAAGGVLGRKLQLTTIDDACDPQIGYEAAKALGDGSGVDGVIGGLCDAAAAREVGVVDASGLPFLVTAATSDDLAKQPLQSTYLMNGTVYQQALSAVFWMNYQRAQRLAVIDDAGAGSQQLAKEAIRLVDETPKLVSLQTVPRGTEDLTTIAAAAVASKPNFIYWTGAPATGGALVKALRAAGYKGTFTASAASESPAFLRAAGPDGAEGAYVTATATGENTPTAAKWLARFEATYKHPPGLDALQSYDAVRTLAHALTKAKSTDGAKVSAQIAKLDVHFTNALGVVRFAGDHTLLYDNRIILQVRHDAFTFKRSLRTDSLQ